MADKTTDPTDAAPGLPKLTKGDWVGSVYIPIEIFRTDSAHYFRGPEFARTFRSSGTTTSSRATSHFSQPGLAAYKSDSVAHFLSVLSQVQTEAAAVGISLIPPPTEVGWTESSLAQMVAWIGETREVRYTTGEGLAALVNSLGNQPVWLFGTAFHWLNAIDANQAVRLPSGSVLFETGGTKGKAREVTRSELYRDLGAAFGLEQEAIASEYGMSELACQAYDFLPLGQRLPLAERVFRFPPWVDIRALGAPGEISRAGRGALIVQDPRRSDYPWPVRTEDLVETDGSVFKLLGRAPVAPLKGCSLLAEDLNKILPRSDQQPIGPEGHFAYIAYDRESVTSRRRAVELTVALATFFAGPSVPDWLTRELGSRCAAEEALRDIVTSLPADADGWSEAAARSAGGERVPQRWIFLLPENHSLVGLHPLAMAYLLGLEVTVRIPKRFANDDNLLTAFVAAMRVLPGADLKVVPPSFRLDRRLGMAGEAVLAFGSDETIASVRAATGGPVRGFGNRVGVTLLRAADCISSSTKVVRDALSLGQAGCMASRLIVVLGPLDLSLSRVSDSWQSTAAAFWSAPLPWKERVGLDMESHRLGQTGAEIHNPEGEAEPLVAWRTIETQGCLDAEKVPDPTSARSAELIRAAIARAPFTLSVLHFPAEGAGLPAIEAILQHLRDSEALGTVTASDGLLDETARAIVRERFGAEFRSLGNANAPNWDGLHEGRPLFVP